MSKRDFYEVLSVDRNADASSIKAAFRRKAAKYHPDKNPDDETAKEKFQEVQEAYKVLSDTDKKHAYDQHGHAAFDPSQGGFGGGAGVGDIFGDFDLGSVFEDIFSSGGRSSRQSQAQQGADLGYQLTITLEEAVRGVSKTVSVTRLASCESCRGSGGKKGSAPATCGTCQGVGQVRMNHGFLQVQQPCPECRGAGQVIKDPCSECRGQGRLRREKALSVKLPAGIDHGDRVRLTGEGEAGLRGGGSGDLYVEVRIKAHDVFKRDGADLKMDVPVSFVIAALGGEIEVPTLSGRVKLTIPAETQTGKVFRLRGKGVKPLRRSKSGDLLCRLTIETPVRLSEEQKEVLRSFDVMLAVDGGKHSPRSKSWFDAVKSFFSK